jgi:membrane protease subunit HflK
MNLNLRTALLRALALVGAPLSAFFSAFVQLYKLLLFRVRGMFNLNDGRWGRGPEGGAHNTEHNSNPNHNSDQNSGHNQGHNQGHNSGSGNDSQSGSNPGPNEGGGSQAQPTEPSRPKPNPSGPPDLDELWKDFNKKIGKLFGNKGSSNSGGDADSNGPNGPNGFFPNIQNFKIGAGLIALVILVIWLGTGFFIVQEGQQAVITQFGGYHSTVGAGINWRLPYPIQRHEIVYVTQIRSIDIGRDAVMKATGLRESAMLTEDENIVEIKFAVQYRLTDARAYLFESKNPTDAVTQAAETAVREVVGKMRMDSALSEERDQIAPRVRAIMQNILDSYKVGIEVVGINLQQGGVRPPEQVQAAFDDVLKAGQERERAKNEAQAYANDVIPRAVGSASRLKQEADAYKARIVAQAEGDAQRFKSLLAEYQKAPQVTRDRLYIDTMQQIYTNVTKVMIDARQGSNLLYLPLDKILQLSGQSAGTGAANTGNNTNNTNSQNPNGNAINGALENDSNSQSSGDLRGRDSRGRERDVR